MTNKEFASKLFLMQAARNQRRGIECIRAICFHLNKDEFKKAKQVYEWDSDKLESMHKDIIKECNEFFGSNRYSFLFKNK